jgi:nucleoside-diphosphate-sugar epimerase
MARRKDTIIVTGSNGLIGSALINKFAVRFALVGLDRASAAPARSSGRGFGYFSNACAE